VRPPPRSNPRVWHGTRRDGPPTPPPPLGPPRRESGALLIDQADVDGLDAFLAPIEAGGIPPLALQQAMEGAVTVMTEVPATPGGGADAGLGFDAGDDDLGMGMDDAWGGAGDGSGSPIHGLAFADAGGPGAPLAGGDDAWGGDAGGETDGEEGAPSEDEQDPWEPLDAAQRGGEAERPLRKGRAAMWERRGPGLEAPAALFLGAAAGVRTREDLLRWMAAPGAAPKSGPAFPELREPWEALVRRNRRAGRGGAAAAGGEGSPAPDAERGDEDVDLADWGADAVGFAEDDEPVEDDLPPLDEPEAADGGFSFAGVEAPATPAPFSLAGGEGLPRGTPGPTPYGRMVARYVDEMQRRAAAEQVQTRLERAVSSWRARVGPLLEEQEGRGDFDIYREGRGLVARLSEVTVALEDLGDGAEGLGGGEAGQRVAAAAAAAGLRAEVPMGEVVGGEGPWAASRGLAALLQLVNSGNVALTVPHGDSEGRGGGTGGVLYGAGDVRVALLTGADRARHLGEYQAPSLEAGARAPGRLNAEEMLLVGGRGAAELAAGAPARGSGRGRGDGNAQGEGDILVDLEANNVGASPRKAPARGRKAAGPTGATPGAKRPRRVAARGENA